MSAARPRRALVVTTIQPPTPALVELASCSTVRHVQMIVVGDSKTPGDFALGGSHYYGLDQQQASGSRLARRLPVGHYARKNLGYLVAMRQGADVILETDDDNFPADAFWRACEPDLVAPTTEQAGWVNAYRYFLDEEIDIWPRGFPWSELGRPVPPFEDLPERVVHCPVHQGLADDDPDVDGVWRLTRARKITFRSGRLLALGAGSWCPFNSQSTRWFRSAFPLLYLPASCSMRLTDIWRSFVAQRVLWANGWHLLMEGPTMRQERNQHDLRADIAAEFPGYAHNAEIAGRLSKLAVGPGHPGDAMIRCYELLVSMRLVARWELECLTAWLEECPS